MKLLSVKLGVAVVIVICFFFVHTEESEAECAWVLWYKYESIQFEKDNPNPKTTGNWELMAAAPKFEQCLAMQKSYFEHHKKLWEGTNVKMQTSPFRLIILDFGNQGSRYIKFECFPDTIDPRK